MKKNTPKSPSQPIQQSPNPPQENIKTFTIEVKVDDKGRSIRRKNSGFETFELLGHLYNTIKQIEAGLEKRATTEG